MSLATASLDIADLTFRAALSYFCGLELVFAEEGIGVMLRDLGLGFPGGILKARLELLLEDGLKIDSSRNPGH